MVWPSSTTRSKPARTVLWCYPTASRNISSDLHPRKSQMLYENGKLNGR
jgi:hypothetical protein